MVRNMFSCLINFNPRLEDWYEPYADAGESQQANHDTSDLEIIPPLSNVEQIPSPAASVSQPPVRLGLGLPSAIRESDSMRRRVTPIPSDQFRIPPILDHTSDLPNEAPPLPNSPEPADQLPADQPPAPSKRGKTRGSTRKTTKASGSHGGRRGRAKVTATEFE